MQDNNMILNFRVNNSNTNKKIHYNEALAKYSEMETKYKKDVFLELDNGKACIVYYTELDYVVLYEIQLEDYKQLSNLIIDFDESNMKVLINA